MFAWDIVDSTEHCLWRLRGVVGTIVSCYVSKVVEVRVVQWRFYVGIAVPSLFCSCLVLRLGRIWCNIFASFAAEKSDEELVSQTDTVVKKQETHHFLYRMLRWEWQNPVLQLKWRPIFDPQSILNLHTSSQTLDLRRKLKVRTLYVCISEELHFIGEFYEIALIDVPSSHKC